MALAGKIEILTIARTQQLEAGFMRASGVVKQFAGQLLGLGGAAAGIYMVQRALRAAVQGAMEFNKAMAQSMAIMGDLDANTRASMKMQARTSAYGTAYTEKDTAKAYYYLASAGYTAEQAMGSLNRVVEFAQAGMFDLQRATDLATDAQSALGLSSKDVEENQRNLGRVTDVLVKANTLANASVEQFSTALTSKAAAAARMVGKDVEEVVAVLAALADQGTKAEEAGTLLNRIWLGMRINALENADAFEKWRIRVYEADGQMRNTADIIADMERSLGHLSAAAKTAAIMELGFNQKTADAAAVLLGTSEKIRGYERELRKAAGTTADVAEKNMPQLNQALSKLRTVMAAIVEIPLAGMLEEMGTAVNDIAYPFEMIAKQLAEVNAGLKDTAGLLKLFHLPKWMEDPRVQKALAPIFQRPSDLSAPLQALGRTVRMIDEANQKIGETGRKTEQTMGGLAQAAGEAGEALEEAAGGVEDFWDALNTNFSTADEIREKFDALLETEKSWREKVATFGMTEGQRDLWRLENVVGIDPAALAGLRAMVGENERLEQIQERLTKATKAQDTQVDAWRGVAASIRGTTDQVVDFQRELENLRPGAAIQGTTEAFSAEIADRRLKSDEWIPPGMMESWGGDVLRGMDARLAARLKPPPATQLTPEELFPDTVPGALPGTRAFAPEVTQLVVPAVISALPGAPQAPAASDDFVASLERLLQRSPQANDDAVQKEQLDTQDQIAVLVRQGLEWLRAQGQPQPANL